MDYIQTMRSYIGHQGLVLVAANIIFIDVDGNYLMQQKSNQKLAFVGGFVDYNEGIIEGAMREAKEEAGIIIDEKRLQLFGVYAQDIMHYPNGDEVKPCSFFFKYHLRENEQLIACPPETEAIVSCTLDHISNILNIQHQRVIEDLKNNSKAIVVR